MAWVDEDDDTFESGPNAYEVLRDHVEEQWSRRGGRSILGRKGIITVTEEPPVLTALRNGEPVTVTDWLVPAEFRPGGQRVRHAMLRVSPDGSVVEVESYR